MRSWTQKSFTKEQQEEAKKYLLDYLKKNRKIYQIVTKVSASGMYRYIRNFVHTKTGIYCIDHLIVKVMSGVKRNDYGIGISGCGMDMGFQIVYELGSILYPKGDGKTITNRNGSKKPETDGGYLIKHTWL